MARSELEATVRRQTATIRQKDAENQQLRTELGRLKGAQFGSMLDRINADD